MAIFNSYVKLPEGISHPQRLWPPGDLFRPCAVQPSQPQRGGAGEQGCLDGHGATGGDAMDAMDAMDGKTT